MADIAAIQAAFKRRATAGNDPEDRPLLGSVYERCNEQATANARVRANAPDKNWWKDPDKFIDGDEQRLHTGYPTERLALRNIRHEARLWIPTIERPMSFAELINTYGVATLDAVLKEARTPKETYEHRRRLGRPLKMLHIETHQTEPIGIILSTGLNAPVPA
jgi:hypothetical protein